MPWEYLLAAYFKGQELHQLEMHKKEQPIALQTAWHANTQRDPKKRREPYAIEDFYMFQPKALRREPEERYGAAALSLQQKGLFPVWGLFCFPALRKAAKGAAPPLVAFIADDAVLLAPSEVDEGKWGGLLIAEKSAGNRSVHFTSPCGREIDLLIPTIQDEVIADEEVTLLVG